jgi:diaminohydroxyphosphoribosylaminopyrimidine deaminase/5-amino-6-(5-phosphoribosylamino)uracil reductase
VKIHEKYILRCIELGKNGLGTTAPNPMVGCVITWEEEVVGEGFTSPYGGPHAEVNAIHAVRDKALLKEATLYVSLEPCSHYGKTPPCADLIIHSGIPRVVIGLKDPHSKVAGKGISKLRDAGIEVICPVLEDACREHHRRFLAYHEKKRPYIILKWAESADGYMAPDGDLRKEEPNPFWISNRYSRQLVHQWRTEEQSILVGTSTVLMDNPELTSRTWSGKNPLRIVMDRTLRIPRGYHIYDGSSETLIFTEVEDFPEPPSGVIYEVLNFSEDLVGQVCRKLYEHQVQSVIIEGGAYTLSSFIDKGIWDEARVFIGKTPMGSGLKAPLISGREIFSADVAGDILRILRND